MRCSLSSEETDLVFMESVWGGGGHRAELTNKQQVRQAGRLEKPVSLPPPCSWLEGFREGQQGSKPRTYTVPGKVLFYNKGEGVLVGLSGV